MKAIEKLQDALQRELAWRKREISDLRTLASQADISSRHIFRPAQVMLCAHWEGFLKRAADLYIAHAFAQDIRLREMSGEMVSISLFKSVMRAASADYPGSKNHHLRLAELILKTINEKVTPTTWEADSFGNPGSEELRKILASIGIDAQLGMDGASWSTTKVFIDEQLVRDRNRIAHGDGLPVERDIFLSRSARLLHLLDTLASQIVDAGISKRYLKQS